MDQSNYVTFKDLNAELSGYQKKISLSAFLNEVDKLTASQKFALVIVLLGAVKTIAVRAIL